MLETALRAKLVSASQSHEISPLTSWVQTGNSRLPRSAWRRESSRNALYAGDPELFLEIKTVIATQRHVSSQTVRDAKRYGIEADLAVRDAKRYGIEADLCCVPC
jgi:hypothetical protein